MAEYPAARREKCLRRGLPESPGPGRCGKRDKLGITNANWQDGENRLSLLREGAGEDLYAHQIHSLRGESVRKDYLSEGFVGVERSEVCPLRFHTQNNGSPVIEKNHPEEKKNNFSFGAVLSGKESWRREIKFATTKGHQNRGGKGVLLKLREMSRRAAPEANGNSKKAKEKPQGFS